MNPNNTLVLTDKSIVVFSEDGTVKLYPSPQWKKPKNDQYHTLEFKNEEQARAAFKFIDEFIIHLDRTNNILGAKQYKVPAKLGV